MKKVISIVLLALLGACGSNQQSEDGGVGDGSLKGEGGGAGATAVSTEVVGQAGAGGSTTAGTSGTAGRGGQGGSGGAAGSLGNSSATGTQATGDNACTKPAFVTSDTNGGWSDGGYYVHNNMWNSTMQLGPETLYACSYHNWYVVSRQTNNAGAVKTYPNVHKDYNNVPISSFKSITSSFAASSPHVGIYNVAYDIWINGVATSGCTEIMIWTENYKQVPSGKKVTTFALDGRSYDVWKTSKSEYIAFVPTSPVTAGTIDLLALFNWVITQGWLPPTSTVGQICYGVEIVSTDGQDATFRFTDFSISSN